MTDVRSLYISINAANMNIYSLLDNINRFP